MAILICSLLLLLSWLSTDHFPPWTRWHAESLTFLALGILSMRGLWFLFRENGCGKWCNFPNITLVFIGFLAVVAVQSITGQILFFGDGLIRAFYLFGCVAALCLGFVMGMSGTTPVLQALKLEQRAMLASTLLVGAFLSGAVAWAQALEVGEKSQWLVNMPDWRRPGGNIGQPNQLATLLVMGVVSLMYLFEVRKLGTLAASVLGVVLICSLAITQSRTGLLSFWIVSVWWLARRSLVGFRVATTVITGACLILPLLYYFWPAALELTKSVGWSDGGSAAKMNLSPGTRLVVWPQLLDAVLERPWFGWGLGEVSKAHNAVLHNYSASETFTYSHNIILDLAIGMGLPLTALLLAACLMWAKNRLKLVQQLLPWYYFALALPLLIHSLFEFPFAYAYLLIPAMLAIGALEASVARKSSFRLPFWSLAVSFPIIVAVMLATVVEYFYLEEDFRVARFETLRMGVTPSAYERPKVTFLNQLVALNDVSRLAPTANMRPEEMAAVSKAAMRFPSPAIQHRYALSLALNGRRDEAIRQLKVMRVMYGERTYSSICATWRELADTKFPQLKELEFP